jgi:hypothetical protein
VTETEIQAPPNAPKLGRPYTPIPDSLVALLDGSYADGTARDVETHGNERAMREVVRLAEIYVRRQGKSLHSQHQGTTLWLRMADKRPYTRKAH